MVDDEWEAPIGWLFVLVAGQLQRRVADNLGQMGLSQSEFACLQLLEAEPGLSNSELARRAGVSRQTMWEIVQALDDAGMATRPRSTYARPAALSRKGKRYLRGARRTIATAERVATITLTAREVRYLKYLLAQITSATGAQGVNNSKPAVNSG